MPAEDPLDRLRADLERTDHGEADADETSEALAARAFSFLESDDLHPTTIELLASAGREIQVPPGQDERARERIERAMVRLREARHPNPGQLLRDARQQAGVSDQEAAGRLGISAVALRRLEGGRGTAALLNLPAERVAAYVRGIRADPRALLAALFAPTQLGAVYGYTPRIEKEERGRLLERASSDSGSRDRQWALAFLTTAERRE